ncbi:Spy/CpxP family protein refolding chaperone [Larkinella sp. VNQ87]|uniref:Spy/CpxP family protein refolding chaperone n=1 Tax=Larkinella sp. VNQ87 TaxID=3400921 RepID=UPI003C07A25A
MRFYVVLLMAASVAVSAQAQHEHHHQLSPYKDQAQQSVKALTAKDVDNYLNGRGMGLAKPGELNGYPGPMHVLELTSEMRLTTEQKNRIQQIYDEMHRKAVELGAQIVRKETELDQLFAKRQITPEALQTFTGTLGSLQGELRNVHLVAHLETAKILSPEQVAEYNKRRGYAH